MNTQIFLEDWEKYAKGSISAWEMEVLCFYYHDHELKDIDCEKYGFVDFNELNGSWLSSSSYISSSIMPYNLYRRSILKPSTDNWNEVSADVLEIKIPYSYLAADTDYTITFNSCATSGFNYEYDIYEIFESEETDVCKSYMYINLSNHDKLKNVTDYNSLNVDATLISAYNEGYGACSTFIEVYTASPNLTYWNHANDTGTTKIKAIENTSTTLGRRTLTLDVSSITGNVYVLIKVYSLWSVAQYREEHIHQIWLE